LKNAAIEFAGRELNSNMIERAAQQVFSRDGWKKCAAFGVQGMPIPKDDGGRNADPITTISIMDSAMAVPIKDCCSRLMRIC
jgi:alkylation response protein AidB-like acyl-CoA dehydrogenase